MTFNWYSVLEFVISNDLWGLFRKFYFFARKYLHMAQISLAVVVNPELSKLLSVRCFSL